MEFPLACSGESSLQSDLKTKEGKTHAVGIGGFYGVRGSSPFPGDLQNQVAILRIGDFGEQPDEGPTRPTAHLLCRRRAYLGQQSIETLLVSRIAGGEPQLRRGGNFVAGEASTAAHVGARSIHGGVRLLVLPKLAGRGQALIGELDFLRAQHPAGGREGLGHTVFEAGVPVRERPAVIGVTGAVAAYLVGLQAAVVDMVIRDIHRIARDVILRLRVFDDPDEDMTRRAERTQQAFHAVLDLLEKVFFSIRDTQQHLAGGSADRGHIQTRLELLLGQGQGQRGVGDAARRQIVVACIVPSAPVQSRNVLVIGKLCFTLALLVAIEVPASCRSLQRVV